MKTIDRYIIEKNNFLVKKHVSNKRDSNNLTLGDFITWVCDDENIIEQSAQKIRTALQGAWERASLEHLWKSQSKYVAPPFKNQTEFISIIKDDNTTPIEVEELNSGGTGDFPYVLIIKMPKYEKTFRVLAKDSFLGE